jgi:hypothetical protein
MKVHIINTSILSYQRWRDFWKTVDPYLKKEYKNKVFLVSSDPWYLPIFLKKHFNCLIHYHNSQQILGLILLKEKERGKL